MSTIETALTFAGHGDWARTVPAARQALASDPQDPMAHALLALGLAHMQQGPQAVEAGRQAVALAPELSFTHYAYGWALLEHAEVAAAEKAAREALRLDPGADEHALLAQVHVRQRRWQDALDVANRGLNVDPEHAACGSLRSVALGALGRSNEAVAGIHELLAQDPDDAYAHANRGWLLLRQSEYEEALGSFKAALRLDPTLDWARAGIIEAMKARNAPYRLVLRYSFWVGTLSARAQWFLILGLVFAGRLIRAALRTNPELWPILGPLFGLYVLLVFGSWIADPLSNLLLRLDPVGRLALTRAETFASNIVGGCLATAAVAGLLFLATSSQPLLILAGVSVLMLVPIGGAVKAMGTRAWRPLASGALAIALVGAAAVASSLVGASLSGPLVGIFIVGAVLYGWIANYLIIKYQ